MEFQNEKLSLLIPVYNERDNIQVLLQTLESVTWPIPVELVFVNDCSTDGSLETLFQCLKREEANLKEKSITYQVHNHSVNQGKGAATHTAIQHATGTLLMVQDADSEYDPVEIPGLITPILQGKADVVYGSRFFHRSGQAHRTYHYLVNLVLTVFSNLLSGLYLSDMETCYKAFRADILKNIQLRSLRFGFEPEVTAHLARLKVRVWELPISYFPRSYVEGKKITWRDGIAAVWHIVRFNWFVSDKQRFHESLPKRFLFKGTSDRFIGHSGRSQPTLLDSPSRSET